MALLTRRRRHPYPETRPRERRTLTLRDEINRLFDDFFYDLDRPFWPERTSALEREFVPRVDITENDGAINVSAELPGMSEEDVDLEVDENTLTLSGEKREEETDEEGGRTWRETSYGRFTRDIPLPASVDADKAVASFKNGRLSVTLPKKTDEQSRRRKIDVQSG